MSGDSRRVVACLLLLGAGLAGVLYQPVAIVACLLMVSLPTLNIGYVAFLPLIPLIFSLEYEEDSIMYDVPLALRTLYYHSINLSVENFVGMWMHQSALFLCALPECGRLLNCLCVGSCSVIMYGMLERAGAKRISWLAPVIVLCAPGIWKVAATSKYDGLSLLFCFLSASAWMDGRRMISGALIGCACACKLTAVPIAVGMMVLGGVPVAVGVIVSLGPWMVRQWLVMGNPLFPVFGSAFSENFYPAIRKVEMQMEYAKVKDAKSLLSTFVWMSPLSAMFAPFCLGGSMAWIGIIGVGGAFILLGLDVRYLLPSLPFLAVPALVSANNILPSINGLIVYAVVSVCVVLPSYRTTIKRGTYHQSYMEAVKECEGKKVLSWGEERKYPNYSPNHVFWSYIAPPLFWKLCRETTSEERILVRMRQLNVDYILTNLLSLKTQHQFADGFIWKKRQYDLFTSFCKNRLVLVWKGSVIDGAGTYELWKFK